MNATDTLPWWRVGMMWLVVMGPALVVVASFITLALAVQGADRPLPADTASHAAPLTPAQLARNHAATPADER